MKKTNMRYFTFYMGLLVLIVLGSCNASSESQQIEEDLSVELSGRINYPEANGLIILEQLSGRESIPIDTIELAADNTFKKEITLKTAGFYRLNIYRKQGINMILDGDNISIIADGNSPNGYYEITGSTSMDKLREYNEYITGEFGPKESELSTRFVQARSSGQNELMTQIQEEYMDLMDEKVVAIKDFIRTQGSSLANLQLVNNLDDDKDFQFKDSVITVLANAYPEEPNVVLLKDQMDKLRKLSVGNPAPEISLPNPEGEVVTLSSFQGKVVLVDFWAEWCKPCRMENPNIVAAYNKYHDQGFDILGVSLDRTKEKWLKGIQEDGLTWNHVSDLQYWNSAAAKTYNITAIPFSILVNEEGTIIAKNLRGKALHDKLDEIFGD